MPCCCCSCIATLFWRWLPACGWILGTSSPLLQALCHECAMSVPHAAQPGSWWCWTQEQPLGAAQEVLACCWLGTAAAAKPWGPWGPGVMGLARFSVGILSRASQAFCAFPKLRSLHLPPGEMGSA